MKFFALFFLLAVPAWAKPQLVAPLILDSQNLGEVWVYKEREIELDHKTLLKALKPAITDATWNKLNTLPERISLILLKADGITIRFDEATLNLFLELKREIRALRSLKIRGTTDLIQEAQKPEDFSGYINLSGAQGFDYPKAKARQSFRGQLDLTTNVKGFVFESGEVYTENDPYIWRRQDTRLTRDFENQLLRVSAGDFTPSVQSYQNSRALGGLSFSRQFSIQPYLNTRPLNRTEVNIKRPSIIEVYVNDAFVSRTNISPGPLELSDFPLFSGVNKVDLKIIDDTGKIEWVNLNLLYDVQLLGAGVQQFAYQAGLPSESYKSDRLYNRHNFTFSAFHRLGLSDRFTSGLSFQNDQASWMIGSDSIYLTRIGTISSELALSRRYQSVSAGAGKLRFKSLDYKLGNDRPIRGTAEVEYKARLFTALGQENTINQYSWRYDLSLSKPISPVTSIGIGTQWNVNRIGGNDRRSVRTDLSAELAPQWKGNATYTIERADKTDHRIQFGISWVEKSGKYYGNFSYDYPAKTERIEASRSPSSQVGDYRATVGAQNSPTELRGDFLGEYTNEKANLRVEHVSTNTKNTSATAHTTTLTVASSVAWAGTQFALTRPIFDSFAILKAKPHFKEFEIPVNPINGIPETVVNKFGPGVIPTLTAYSNTPIYIDSTSIPFGYSIGQDHRVVRPTYKSGLFIPVGGDSTVLLKGKLFQPDGKPLSLASGQVISGNKSVSFFTNREGIFLLEDLSPGKYQLKIDESDFAPLTFFVKEDQKGIFKLPNLTLKKGSN